MREMENTLSDHFVIVFVEWGTEFGFLEIMKIASIVKETKYFTSTSS